MRRAALVFVTSGVMVLTACGGSSGSKHDVSNVRTVANFCSHYQSDKSAYLTKYDAEAKSVSEAQQSNPLAGLLGLTGMSFQMLGSVEEMFDDLATVAPSDIQTQVEQVRDSIKKQEDQISNENPTSGGSIISTLLGSLETSLESSDSWQRVGDYVQTHCEGGGQTSAANSSPDDSQASSVTPSNSAVSTPGSTASAPAPGTTLASVQGDGRINVISNPQGQGFTVVDSLSSGDQDESFLQAYDAAGNPLAKVPEGSITGECGAADVINARGRLLIAEKLNHQDAQGIQPASDTLTLTAYDATSGNQIWTTTLDSSDQNGIDCGAYDGYLGSQASGAPTFTATFDGRWGVYQPDDRYDLSHSIAIDLTTGKTYPKPNLYGALGNWVTIANKATEDDYPVSLTLTTPDRWSALGTLTLGNGMLEKLPGPDDLELATSGAQFPTDNVYNPTAAAITPDGKTLIGYQERATVAYSLPTMKKLWSTGAAGSVDGINDTIAVLTQDNGDGGTSLIALNTQSGAKVWQQNIKSKASVCALTTTQMVILVNGQLAFLNTNDGHQTSYQAANTQDNSGQPICPGLLAGGVSGLSLNNYDNTGANNNYTVTQLATP